MKPPTALILLALALTLPGSPSASAAEEAPSTPMYIRLNHVQLADRAAFSEVMTAWSAFVKEKFPNQRGWEVLFGNDGGAVFLRSGDSLGAFEKYEEEGKKVYEAYQASGQPDRRAQWMRAYTQESSSIWLLREDLSYLPSAWPSPEELPFRWFRIVHLKRDMVEDAEKALKTLADIDRKLGLQNHHRAILQLKTGSDAPAFAMVVPAKDIFDYYAGFAKRRDARSQDPRREELGKVLDGCVRSAETLHLTVQPELSKLRPR